ncbi:hypothetical protein BKA69DRAFT_1073919 [Paraphysoderma sedebokerense]|nr:hypothetical protein BKA69DRAFT_1073919 [Paraphysoderma sedebokerense]
MKASSISTKSKSYLSQRQAQLPRNRKTEENKIAELIEQCQTWSLDTPSKLKPIYDLQPSTPKQTIDPNGQLTNGIVLVGSGDDGFRTMMCGNPAENQRVLNARLSQNQVTNIKEGQRLQSQQNYAKVLVSAMAPAELTTSPMDGIQRSYNPMLYGISNNQTQVIPNEYANYSSAVNSNNALEQMKSAYLSTNQVETQSMSNLRKGTSRSPSSQVVHLASAGNSISTKPTENQPHNCASPGPSLYTTLRRASSSRFFRGKHRLLRKELKVMGGLQINRESDDFKARMQKVKKSKEYGEKIRQMNCVLADELDHTYKVRNNDDKSEHKPSRYSPITRHRDNQKVNADASGIEALLSSSQYY